MGQGFVPELVQFWCSCGVLLSFSSSGGKIPVGYHTVLPAHNCIFLFLFLINSDVKFYALIKASASGVNR